MLDASALGAWQTLSDRLGAFLARRVRPEDVDDLRQDVLLRVYKHSGELTDAGKFGPWVYAIARNAVIDRHRRRSTSNAPLTSDLAALDASDLSAPLENCVAPFVARLPRQYREALTLTDMRGMTQADAAALLGVSTSGMKSRVQRGRKMLRAMFEECCRLTTDGRGRVIEIEPASAARKACSRCG